MLIEQAEGLLRGKGVMHSRLSVEEINEPAIRLYERLGYVKHGEIMETWAEPTSDGDMQPVDHQSWVMRKEL